MSGNRRKIDTLIGLAVVGSGVTGAVGFFAAIFALLMGEFAVAGVCLIAAALSFGLLANAVLRG